MRKLEIFCPRKLEKFCMNLREIAESLLGAGEGLEGEAGEVTEVASKIEAGANKMAKKVVL